MSSSNKARISGGAAASDGTSRLGQVSWVLFDWAGQPYFTLITTFIFFPYFASTFVGDPVHGQELLGYALAAAGAITALSSPVLGAIADATGPRKPWLFVFLLIFVVSCGALWWAVPGDTQALMFIIVMIVVSSVTMEASIVFTNAMLPGLVPDSQMGRLSGIAWGFGYVGGLASLFLILIAFVLPGEVDWPLIPAEPLFGVDVARNKADRLTGPLSALWFAIFAVPLFLFTPDKPRSGLTYGQAVRQGFTSLKETVRKLGAYRNILLFLIARMIYNDGLVAIFSFGGVYARGVFGWDIKALGLFGIVLASFAAVGCVIGGRLDDRIGSKPTVIIALMGLVIGTAGAASVSHDTILFVVSVAPPVLGRALFGSLQEVVYLAFAILIGLSGGPAQAASRTLMARLAPQGMVTEFFGLYALSGKATSFAAPALVALMTGLFADQRAGLFVIVGFLVTGLVFLLLVVAKRAALAAS
jgi:UMF1 family MFS transporter